MQYSKKFKKSITTLYLENLFRQTTSKMINGKHIKAICVEFKPNSPALLRNPFSCKKL